MRQALLDILKMYIYKDLTANDMACILGFLWSVRDNEMVRHFSSSIKLIDNPLSIDSLNSHPMLWNSWFKFVIVISFIKDHWMYTNLLFKMIFRWHWISKVEIWLEFSISNWTDDFWWTQITEMLDVLLTYIESKHCRDQFYLLILEPRCAEILYSLMLEQIFSTELREKSLKVFTNHFTTSSILLNLLSVHCLRSNPVYDCY